MPSLFLSCPSSFVSLTITTIAIERLTRRAYTLRKPRKASTAIIYRLGTQGKQFERHSDGFCGLCEERR